MHTVNVDLGDRSYDIEIGADLDRAGERLQGLGLGRKMAVVTNPTVKNLYGARLIDSLKSAGFLVMSIDIPDGEHSKSLDWTNAIYTALLINSFDRKSALVALGGGVIGDLTGFAAATFMRGVPFIQVPTTLLAMVDSSVGGKTGVNHPMGKNMIGAFYQPKKVLMDLAALRSLPKEEFLAGMAEVIKYGVIRDAAFLDYLEKNREKILALEPEALEYIVRRSCEIKAEVVAKDERETGLRAILNFGHTVGHAIETAENYTLRHGYAVAIGMVYASRLAHTTGLCDASVPKRVEKLVRSYGLPADLSALGRRTSVSGLIGTMQIDKKAEAGKVKLVLPKKIGEVVITKEWEEERLRELLAG
ncbi:MAG TPA: 3-dehydroquinate synthase [Nitrospirota bacterium]|nr:3-dehydroquinate synthase [Nitrospirota bacterium]